MRWVAAVALMILAAQSASAAPAAPVADQTAAGKPYGVETVFRALDLFGTWAVDCKRPAASDNPHVTDEMLSPDVVLERHAFGPDAEVNRYSILTAERLSKTRLALVVIFQPGSENEQRQRLVLTVRDGTRRTLFNQTVDGPVRVKDGVAVGLGLKTPLLRKCE